MRGLASSLGVDDGVALYRYVGGREQLLDDVVAFVIDDPTMESTEPVDADDWQGILARAAHGVRRIALTHPQLFTLIATRPSTVPWVRPPLRSLAWMESFPQTLLRSGFSDRAAVAGYRAFASFLLGHLLLEVAALDASIGPVHAAGRPESSPAELAIIDPASYPRVRVLHDELSRNRSDALFAASLTDLTARSAGICRMSPGGNSEVLASSDEVLLFIL